MTGHQAANLSPSACFVVERVPGEGYRVTSAEGRYASEWKGRALALLDTLGQPDPKGPAEYYRWVGPITPSGEYVGVSVKITPSGEARYHQAWFRAAKPMTRRTRSIGLLILVMLVSFGAGAYAGRTLLASGVSATSGPASGNGSPGSSKVDPAAEDVPPDPRLAKLREALAKSAKVRDDLRRYFAQEGLAADLSKGVVDRSMSVTLTANAGHDPPVKQRNLDLTNIDVAQLLRLLDALDELATGPNPKPPRDSERR